MPALQPFADAEADLQATEHALATTPADTNLLLQRARLLDRLAHPGARKAYLDVLTQDPDHEIALVGLGALLFAQRFTSAARTALERATAINPGNLAARIHLADLLRLAEHPALSQREYQAALAIDPDCRQAHQGLAYLLEDSDPPRAEHHRRAGFTGLGTVTTPYRGQSEPIRVLRLVSAYGGNIPLDEVLDDRLYLVHTVVADFADPNLALPAHDVVFNTVGDPDRCALALQRIPALLARTTARVLNPPARIAATARTVTHQHLTHLPGVLVPRCLELPRAQLQASPPPGFALPFLLRSPGFHTGQHFRQIRTEAELPAALADMPGETLLAIDYVQTRSPDGRFRKYRVMLLGGALLPAHLAIADDWKVHHYTAGMAASAAARAEEAHFLDHMAAVLGPVALAALAAIQATLGLDYAGVDFALLPDGRVTVFEANATMTIASPAADPIWDYRRPAIHRAIAAAQSLLAPRVNSV